jgi:hypothetical protein
MYFETVSFILKTCYMFQFFQECIIRHRLKNIEGDSRILDVTGGDDFLGLVIQTFV